MKSLLLAFVFLLFTQSLLLADDIEPSGFSLYNGGKFYVLTDGVFGSDQEIKVRFESGEPWDLKGYGGVDVRLYRIPKPLEFLRAQKNLHRPSVQGKFRGEGLINALTYLWDVWYKKSRLIWQRVFSSEARKAAVAQGPELAQVPAHSYHTQFSKEPQYGKLKGFELVESFRYPVWQAQVNKPPTDTRLEGSSSNFINTKEGNVILPLGKRKPGLYLVEAMIGSHRATTLAFVSDSIVVSKVSTQQALVWTAHRQTGVGRSGSKILLTDGLGVLDRGAAGTDGVYISKRSIPERSFALVEDSDGGVSVTENFFYNSEIYQSKIFIFTDRPLYQPGDEVQVRAFGRELKREGGKDAWEALKGASADLAVIDASGVTLFTKKMDWDGAHGGDASFRLPDTAGSGGYSLRLKFQNEEYGAAFRVARFVKPHLDVQIFFDKPAYKVGEVVKGQVVLTYPTGQPVVGADVDLQLRAEPMTMFEASYAYAISSPVELSVKSFRSDKKGLVRFEFPAATKPSRYIAKARAMDQGAFRVTSKKELLIEGYLENYLLTSDYSSSDPGVAVKIQYTRQGSENSDQAQPLDRWQAIRLEDRSVKSGPIKDVDRGEFTMKLEQPGHYVVRVVDVSGVTRATRAHVVLGPDLKSVTGQLEILADRDSYSIGDSARFLLTFPFKAQEALVSLERNEVTEYGQLGAPKGWFSAKRLSDSQWEVKVPVRAGHAPNIIFSVAYVQNGEFGFQNYGIVVKKPAIDIIFKADKAFYAPGEKVVVNVETRLEGKPLSALVAVGVVDEMIYVLQPEIAPAISEFFHYQRRNQVRTTSSLSFYSFNPSTSVSDKERSFSRAERDVKLLQERARRDAKETAYWNGKLKTDAGGKGRFEFVMPDALTRWRVTGRAISLKGDLGSVGEAKAFLLSKKEHYLKWTGPTHFRSGDQPAPALVAFNSTGKSVQAQVEIAGQNGFFENQKISLNPGSNSIFLKKIPSQSQTLTSRLLVEGKVVDALDTPILYSVSGWTEIQSQIVGLTKAVSLSIPKEALNVRLKIMPDATYQFVRIADDLMEYPFGCVEQVASRLIPLSLAVKALESSSSPEAMLRPLREAVAANRRSLVAMAGPDARFTWWGEDSSESLMMTAHAYHADWRATQVLGINIPRSNWEHLLEVYRKVEAPLVEQVYALWVLSHLDLPVKEQVRAVIEELTPGALEIFEMKSSSGQKVLEKNISMARPSGASLFFPPSDETLVWAVLTMGVVAESSGVELSEPFKGLIREALRLKVTLPVVAAAQVLYETATKKAVDLERATQILEMLRIESPTIDRAIALSFIEQALPKSVEIKSKPLAIDLGKDWIPDSKSVLPAFRAVTGAPATLPAVPGAVAEVIYELPEGHRSTMDVSVIRTLYRLEVQSKSNLVRVNEDDGDPRDTLVATQIKPGENLDPRTLYLDEIQLISKGSAGRFMLLEVPLPAGAEVDGTTWGLKFEGLQPNFQQPRASSTEFGYSIPVDSLDLGKTVTFHQLVRFGSRGQFSLPPTRLFKMYRPSEHAYEELVYRELAIR